MPEPQTDIELPVEDAVEQEQPVSPVADPDDQATDTSGPALEASEADYAEQQAVVSYDDEDYR